MDATRALTMAATSTKHVRPVTRATRRAREVEYFALWNHGLPLTEPNFSLLSHHSSASETGTACVEPQTVDQFGAPMFANILQRMSRPSTLQRTRLVLQHMQQSTSASQKAEVIDLQLRGISVRLIVL